MVVSPGPPWVMIQNRSKAMIALIVVRISTSSSVGRSQGKVIRQNRRHGPAPSTRAALCRFSGIDCSPPRTSRQVRGAWIHT